MDATNKRTGGNLAGAKAQSPTSANAHTPVLPRPDALLKELEAWRRELGISREKFAVSTLGVSHSTYERWLRGDFNPRLKDALHYVALLADRELVPSQLDGRSDPVLVELWENPRDDSYDEL